MREDNASASSPANAGSAEAITTAVGRPRATSCAKLGPERMAGLARRQGLRHDLRHEPPRSTFDALGADDDPGGPGKHAGERLADAAHGLRRHRDEESFRFNERGEGRCRGDRVIEAQARKPRAILAMSRHRLGLRRIARPQDHWSSGARDGAGERRAPSAGPHDADHASSAHQPAIPSPTFTAFSLAPLIGVHPRGARSLRRAASGHEPAP